MAKKGMKGLFYRKYDSTMCTYCSGINGMVLSAINMAWDKKDFGHVEVLTGKKMAPAKGMEATVLLGKCMYQAHKNNPDIKQMIAVKGCPPALDDITAAFEKAGIPIEKSVFENADLVPGFFMKKVKGDLRFDDSFFRVKE